MLKLEWLKRHFRKPTALERAARELGQLEHSILDVNAEIAWAQKRLEYYRERKFQLTTYVKGEAK